MLDVTHAKYVSSCVDVADIPVHNGIEIVLLGRSNVGKSTFINKITNRKKLAYTSQTPGKTQTLNIYEINPNLVFVDVPGYGYAKVSKTQREAFGNMIEGYLLGSDKLKLALLLIDFKVGPTQDDLMMFDFLAYHNIPFVIIATKYDKIAKSKRKKQEDKIINQLGIQKDNIIFYSATDDVSVNKIKDMIENEISAS